MGLGKSWRHAVGNQTIADLPAPEKKNIGPTWANAPPGQSKDQEGRNINSRTHPEELAQHRLPTHFEFPVIPTATALGFEPNKEVLVLEFVPQVTSS